MTTAQLHNIFLACGGKLSTDSRNISGGELFVALKGENFDGNLFALKALEDGAAYSVVDRDSDAARSDDPRIIAVDGTLTALQQLAAYHRENTLHDGKRIKMLALTGTNGKTTTKELVKAVLSRKYRLTATEGNLNNNIGVPFTLLKMNGDTEMAVVEMGASHPGDIKELVEIAHPDYGLVTNVGRAHLLGFVNFEGVKKTKGELYDYLMSVRGGCFVNQSSADLMEMAGSREGLITIPYGHEVQKAEVLAMNDENPYLSLKVEMDGTAYTVKTKLIGSYNTDNVLAALAVGRYFGVSADDAVGAIESYVPSNNRSQMVVTGRNRLIVDAYNANPSSMSAALENFALIDAESKAVFLGDMLELGAESYCEHVKVVKRLCDMKAAVVILVGEEFSGAVTDKQFMGSERVTGFFSFKTSDEAAEFINKNALNGFTILIKGSRGTRMEKLIPYL